MTRKAYIYHCPIERKYKRLYGAYPFDDKDFSQEKIDNAWNLLKKEHEKELQKVESLEQERLISECPFV